MAELTKEQWEDMLGGDAATQFRKALDKFWENKGEDISPLREFINSFPKDAAEIAKSFEQSFKYPHPELSKAMFTDMLSPAPFAREISGTKKVTPFKLNRAFIILGFIAILIIGSLVIISKRGDSSSLPQSKPALIKNP